ncbi:MAG: clostripain-related cysteine peptidase, partial [Pirellulaceae bacterium]|nr:clostripain-related cysteine peptidase [Pirellulaceae bacterium]
MSEVVRLSARRSKFRRKKKTHSPRRRRRLHLEALEPRRLLDASAPAILQWFEAGYDVMEDRLPDVLEVGYGAIWTPPPGRADSGDHSVGYDVYDRFDLGAPPLSVVLVNDQLPWTADLIAAANHDSITLAYDGNDFSNQQLLDLLASTLSQHNALQIESVSLFAHGNEGIVHLADNLAWTTDTLSADRELFRELDALLTDDASIYLYSCSVAGSADGELFIDQLATLTGSTIHASDDPVGNTGEADWNWEYVTGASSIGYGSFDNLALAAIESITLAGDWAEENTGQGNETQSNAFLIGAAGELNWSELSIHSSSDVDWYRFWLQDTGDQNSKAGINFSHALGDLNIELYDDFGNYLASSMSDTDNEEISLNGLPFGYYYLKVSGFWGAQNDYSIAVAAPYYAGFMGDFLETSGEPAIVFPDISDPGFGIYGLNIHSAGDYDLFRIKLFDTANSDHFISVYDFDSNKANVDLRLWDADWNYLTGSFGDANFESVELEGAPYGIYYLEVFPRSNTFNEKTTYKVFAKGPVETANDWLEPNNSIGTASHLGSTSDYLWDLTIPNGDGDFFEFALDDNGTVNDFISISFDHSQADLELAICDSTGTLLDYSNGLTDFETIDFYGFSPGTYYALVYSRDDTMGEYQLFFSPPPPLLADASEVNNTLETATILGSLNSPYLLSDQSIHTTTDEDWFKFHTSDWGTSYDSLSIDFVHERGDLALELYIEDAGEIYFVDDSNSWSDLEQISLYGLPPATYYVRVTGYGQTNPLYGLRIQPPGIAADNFEPNNETFRDLGSLRDEKIFKGLTIHSSTDIDWYQFDTRATGGAGHDVHIDFDHRAGDLELELYNAQGLLADSTSATDDEFISLAGLAADTYYLRVYGYAGSTSPNYTLTIDAPTGVAFPADRLEVNNSLETAQVVSSNGQSNLTGISTIEGLTIHDSLDHDYFKITTINTSHSGHSIQLLTGPNGGDLDFELLNSSGQLISSGRESDNSDSLALNGLAAGTYYVHVYGAAGATNFYNLKLDVPKSANLAENLDAWTILVYMTVSDLPESAFQDLNEMEVAASSLPDNVNLAVYLDRSSDSDKLINHSSGKSRYFPYTTGNGTQASWGDAGRAFIVEDTNTNQVATTFERVGEKNTGDPTELVNFIQWATDERPAENYALIMWDHGSGLTGFNNDNTDDNQSSDTMFTSELVAALNSDVPYMDLIAFDSCLMAVAEVGYSLRNHTDVFIGSQEVMYGFNHSVIYSILEESPKAVTAEELGSHFVDGFSAAHHGHDGTSDTLSAMRTSEYDSLASEILAFTTETENATASDWNQIAQVRNSTMFYELSYLRDFGGFLGGIENSNVTQAIRDAAADTNTQLKKNATIVKTNDRRASSGTSIYLPHTTAVDTPRNDGFSGYTTEYAAFNSATNWFNFADNLRDELQNQPAVSIDWSEGNNSYLDAHALNRIAGEGNVYPALSLHTSLDEDWFSFETLNTGSAANQLSVTPQKPQDNIRVTLYDLDRVQLQTKSGVGVQTIDLNSRPAASYYVRVDSPSSSPVSGYSLVIDAPDASASQQRSNTNDTAEKARQLGVISRAYVLSGEFIEANTSSWLDFDTPISLNSTPANIRLIPTEGSSVTAKLFDSSDAQIASATGSGILNLPYSASGGAESYSIQISTGNSDASYSLVFAPSPTAVDDFYSVAEDITLSVTASGSVVLNDVSPNSQLHHVSLVDSPSHGDLTLNTDGTFSYVPNDEYAGLDSFTYRFDNDLAVSDVATVTIEITAVNDFPTLTALANLTIDEDTDEQTINFAGVTAGGGESQSLQFTATSSNPTLLADPEVSYTPNETTGSLTLTPTPDQHGETIITVTVTDAGLDGDFTTPEDNASFSRAFTVTIHPINDNPTVAEVVTTTDADTPLLISLPFYDIDGDPLSIQIVSLDVQEDVQVEIDEDNLVLHYDPTASAALQALDKTDSLQEQIVLSVSDGQGGEATATVTIDVVGVTDWQNPHNPMDVNGDGTVSTIDIVLVINLLNLKGSHSLAD